MHVLFGGAASRLYIRSLKAFSNMIASAATISAAETESWPRAAQVRITLWYGLCFLSSPFPPPASQYRRTLDFFATSLSRPRDRFFIKSRKNDSGPAVP